MNRQELLVQLELAKRLIYTALAVLFTNPEAGIKEVGHEIADLELCAVELADALKEARRA